MIDFLLGAALVALVIRGWTRGLVREAVGLAALVVGTLLAFRLAGPAGAVVSGMSGASPGTARLVGGTVVFLLVAVGAAVVAAIMHRGVRALPGLPTANRIGGATVAAGAGALVAALLLSVIAIAPLPGALARQIDDSALASTLTDPDGLPQRAIGIAAGDDHLAWALRLDSLVGSPSVGDPGDDVVILDVDPEAPRRADRAEAEAVERAFNEARVAGGAAPLTRSADLDAVALSHASTLYAEGRVAHTDAGGDGPEDRLADAGVRRVRSGELVGLATSGVSVVATWKGDPEASTVLTSGGSRRFGVGVVEGPVGHMVVVVLVG